MVRNRRYQDTGCELADKHLSHGSCCTECPFDKCVIEEVGVGIATARREIRDKGIVRMIGLGCKQSEIATHFRVHRKTIQRVLKRIGT